MCQIVFSLGYYGTKKTTKTNKLQGMQLSPTLYEHNEFVVTWQML